MSGRVVTYGSFDLFHIGHLRLLERCKQIAGNKRLIVHVSTDEFHEEKKGVLPIISFSDRIDILNSIGFLDAVYEENDWGDKERFLDVDDILVMGDDWVGKFDDLPCTVVYLPRTPGISTTEIKERIRNG